MELLTVTPRINTGAILGLNQWPTATCARANVAARRIRFPMVPGVGVST